MQSRLLKSSQQHEFVAAQFSGTNDSGYQPLGDNVLVAPDTAAEKTSGGIHLTPDSVEKMTLAAETGVIVALASDAFLWSADRTRKWEGLKPKVGDRVYVQRYSGQLLLGKDQKIYRVMSDTCVAAVEIVEFTVEDVDHDIDPAMLWSTGDERLDARLYANVVRYASAHNISDGESLTVLGYAKMSNADLLLITSNANETLTRKEPANV